jgi:parallel beta-helix repeat protein
MTAAINHNARRAEMWMRRLAKGLTFIGTTTAVLFATGAAPASASAPIVVHPGESIQAAVDAAHPGDTVMVSAGTYHEAVCVTTDGIRLRGQGAVILPPAQPPLTPCSFDASGQTVGIGVVGAFDPATGEVSDPVSDVTISGFRVEGFEAVGIAMIGGHNVDIVDNTAVNNEEYGIARFVSTGGSLRNNRATGSEEAGLYLGDSPEAHATIVGNTAWDNGFFGIFVRDSAHGTVVGNTSYGNCVGIITLSSHAIVEDWTVTGNTVHDNVKACPASDDGPPASGIGIAVAGGRDIVVRGNDVGGNRATGPTIASGGVVVFGLSAIGGPDPNGGLVQGNQLRDNDPDLYYDSSGTDNRFVGNACVTSIPTGLC